MKYTLFKVEGKQVVVTEGQGYLKKYQGHMEWFADKKQLSTVTTGFGIVIAGSSVFGQKRKCKTNYKKADVDLSR